MKKAAVLLAVLILLSALTGCSAEIKNDTPEALIQNYLNAVKDKDYEAIWNMIPSKIQDYAIDRNIIADKEDGLDYIYYAVNDYYWLVSLDLPSRDHYSFEIIEVYTEDKHNIQQYLTNNGIKLVVEEAQFVECSITAGDIQQDASFFLIKSGDFWYMASVVGDDEIFVY